ncbi:EamA family transporter RarD [Campylobacter mucosalis]|uniref:Resistance permease RarD n=1 Tax=Campylobacter mucosalis CCUG 21559 TaxID=1032067 RepID=A0A6G5QHK8_9BACT|nr:EamA family transporter RarD [Campylobacter mucosalis]QCD45141.1 resistance permease RarD [Campylobacter mucosalis CCUG 21559]
MLQNESQKGFLYAFLAFFSWGVLFPIFFSLYDGVGSYEILAHRIIWSAIFMAIFLSFSSKLKETILILKQKRIRNALLLSGFLISLNWWIYVYAVGSGQILEASLGYFINPLMNMLLGAIVLKERLNFVGKIAVGIVALAVLFQIYTIGSLPLIAIFLPLSFAIYALVRKKVKVPAMQGLFIETLLVFPFAVLYFVFINFNATNHFSLSLNGLLMVLSGLITIFPLVAFNAAAARISLTSLGFMQYLSPTLSACVAVILFNEVLSLNRAVSFGLIWLAIGIVSFDLIIRRKNG